ncbi:hypothetical protein ODE01S_00080 [Oceanithermus desulfurans NBRC 100063]|uniref:Uncharacterized protein n=1 Tax=Oceanithermus desulfurans NBRC 100063 TaxID=1227550 RepID=A0A511RFZ5_9DEIN|nr:hypothetical protein ODE01S_00080 [Oceanithermus desulfurans NBRC 100063]
MYAKLSLKALIMALLLLAGTGSMVGTFAATVQPQQYSGIKKMGCWGEECEQCGEQIRFCRECEYCQFIMGFVVNCWSQWECGDCFYGQYC